MKFKSYLIITFCLVSAAFAKAQKADTAQAIVHYKFSHIRDTTKRDTPYVENMVLLIGRNASVYKSYDRSLQEERIRKSIAEQVSTGTNNFNIKSSGGPTSAIEYFQFPNDKKLVTKERIMNSYLTYEDMPVISWKISADTATFGGLQCQKATTHFKGRDYIAWFCPDLPYRAGPWKLNGLPGLIVEAYDTKKEVVFKFDGLQKVEASTIAAAPANELSRLGTVVMFGGLTEKQDPNLIALPKNGIKATAKEVKDLKELMRKDPQAAMQAQIAAMQSQMGANNPMRGMSTSGGMSAGISSINVQTSPGAAKSMFINNPLELPEKK